MKKLFLLVLLISISGISQKTPIYKKAKIRYNTISNFKALSKLGIPLDHGIHKQGVFIISDFSEKEIEAAKSLGLQVDILIEDVGADFLKRNEMAKNQDIVQNPSCSTTGGDATIDYPTPTNFALGSMGGYLTYQEMLDNLDAMHSKYPNLITARANVGNFLTNGTPDSSVSPSIGGNALQWVRISDNPNTDETTEPEILYNSIHHAREPASLSQLIYYMWYLLENYETDPEVKEIVDATELYFIPVVNPDGYLYNQVTNPNGGGLWRKNRFNTHGVDINRNYDHYKDGTPATAVWNTVGTSNNTSSEIYAGTSAFSEVETQAMKWFIDQHDFTISIDNHTSGDLLLMPYGFEDNNPTPEGDIYQVISEEMVSQNNYNNILITELTVAAGGSVDYIYGGTTRPHKRIFGFGTEIGDSFWPTSNLIDGICKEMMFLNLKAAKLIHNYGIVEDNLPGFIHQNTFNATYTVKRLGLMDSGENFMVSIIPTSNNITSVGTPKSYNGFTIGQTQEDFISINLDNTIQNGDQIMYDIKIDSGDITETISVTKTFGNLSAVVDNNANSLNEYTNQGWGISTTTFVSATGSITESPNGNYDSNQNKTIEYNQIIDLSSAQAANVQYYAKWNIENNWDYAQFEVSTDGGTSWISQCGKYTNPGSVNGFQPEGEPLYDGNQNDWILEEIDLSDYLGQRIKIRFQFASDDQVNNDGFYFDDLVVNSLDQSVLNVSDNLASLFKIFPNPTNNVIKVQPPSLENYILKIRNILGQEIFKKEQNTGYQEFNVSEINPGLYFIIIEINKNRKVYKVLKQ